MVAVIKKLHRPQGETETGLETPVPTASWPVRQCAECKAPESERFQDALRQREHPKTDGRYQRREVRLTPKRINTGIIPQAVSEILPTKKREGR